MGKNVQSNKQPFMQHVQELRQRLFIWALSALAGGAVGYTISDTIQSLLIKPLNQPLFYTSPTGGFDFLLRICIFFGILTSIPIFTYHLLKFIEPTLAKKTRFLIVKLLLSSVVLAGIGVSFAYFVSLPAALHFLGDFGNDNIKSLISTDAYMSFVMLYLAGYALLFQLPLILLFINRAKPMRPKKLMGAQRFVVLGSFVVSAMLTPTPDPINQGIMAGPMIALYELSIVLIWITNRRLYKAEKRQRAQQEKLRNQAAPLPVVRPMPIMPERQMVTPLRRAINDIPRSASREPVRTLPASALLNTTKPVASRHTLNVPKQPIAPTTVIAPAPRPAPIVQNVPRSVWSPPSVIALAEQPIKRPPQTAPHRRPAVQEALTVDLSKMKYDPFNRRSRNVIDMRPKPLQGEGLSA